MHSSDVMAVSPSTAWTSTTLAWALCALSIVLVTGAGVLIVLNGSGIVPLMSLLTLLSCAFVGGIIASRHSSNPIGWFFLVSAVSFALTVFTDEYATYGLLTEPGSLPLASAMVWPQSWLWVPGAVLILAFVPLYFPDGHLASRHWRPFVWFAVTFSVTGAIYSALAPGEIQQSGFVNPFGIERQPTIVSMFGSSVLPLWLGLLMTSAASLVIRFRRARADVRHQIKWLAFAASMVPVWFIVSPAVEEVAPTLYQILDPLALAGIPLTTGVAILRYRLYEIDLIINRTLVYGALTACVVGIYVFIVAYMGAFFRTGSDLLVSLVATGVVAVAFAPLRERLQRGVNRLMYGERDEPYTVLSRLGRRLKDTTTPQAVLPAIAETAAHALRLPYAAIVLKRDDGTLEMVAAHGSPSAEPTVLPLAYGTETIGQLIVSPRAPGEPFDPADRRLLDDLARHAEAAAYAVRLTSDLQRSREHLVTAREEERRRLRRDLHDGLGPQLATLTLKLDAARNLLARDPQATDTLLAGLKAQIQAAIADIRRLVYDLRPPALDELGLIPAIREQAMGYAQAGLYVSIEAPENLPPLPAAVEVAGYRIVQEALTNVSRHAQARVCHVTLSLGDSLVLQVTDDGIGLSEDRRAGVGLSSMRERAAELGGTCVVESLGPAGGTRVLARLPLPDMGASR